MRSKKALMNSLSALLLELVTVVCGFILPRLILSRFGSVYNGITTSISQFLGYIALLRSGIGGVTRASLYKPLHEKDTQKISAIVNATEIFMRQIAKIFVGLLFVFAVLYPFIVSDEFPWLFSFTLILILGIGTFAQYYFGITYQILLLADQRQYIFSGVQIVTTILNTLVATALIQAGGSIHVVKLGSAIVFALNPICINVYVRRKYSIDRKVEPDKKAIGQRWDSFAHQLADFVHNNTDVVLLTVFSTLSEVSVYSVYAMVATGVRKLVYTLATGMESAFGNMLANKETTALERNLELLEFIIFFTSGICFSASIVLIVPFVQVYTAGLNDADYIRPLFGVLLCIAELFWCIRIPYQSVVLAAGKFRETRNGAIAEPVINIVISVALVWKFGIVGVAIGTVAAMAFRTMQYAWYMSKHIVERSIFVAVKKILILACNVGVNCVVCTRFVSDCTTYRQWVVMAVICVLVICAISLVFALIFDRKNMVRFITKMKNALMKRT